MSNSGEAVRNILQFRQETTSSPIRYSISAMGISDEAIDKDIALMQKYGVEVKCGAPAPSVAELKAQGYTHILLATGAWKAGKLDIEGNVGADVLAAADGVITEVRYDPMMGQTVVIKHNDTYTTVYQNMQTVIPEGISVGASVKGGQKIGSVGETALIEISESPHLHFSVLADGKYVNPLSYITVSASAGNVWYED